MLRWSILLDQSLSGIATHPYFVLINCCHSDNKGKEVISRYTTTMATNKMWYTDANGREMKLRVCVFVHICVCMVYSFIFFVYYFQSIWSLQEGL